MCDFLLLSINIKKDSGARSVCEPGLRIITHCISVPASYLLWLCKNGSEVRSAKLFRLLSALLLYSLTAPLLFCVIV